MNFRQAVQALFQGKIVRRASWMDRMMHVRMTEIDGRRVPVMRVDHGEYYREWGYPCLGSDWTAEDWVLVEVADREKPIFGMQHAISSQSSVNFAARARN
ncbi:hypothetical protein D3876_08220 [Sphingomonas cavernae]|uniref:Thoeris anti-defense 2-like domain-containing protein n=2 Tax=Sphingomonas cavernae TaxID=2320861 RepID=A0A418WJQ4_9SPHN|nr:hypothetical protein D3876_08220 [Sphingomonas cavernae]